jgi:mono/diheme cytochrome c family protein
MKASGKYAAVALVLSAGLFSPARAAPPNADQIAAGRELAHRVCGACHVVTQPSDELPVLSPPGPSLAVLAQRPQLTEPALRDFLASSHGGMGPHQAMPNPRLADYQIDEIVAFMMSLKGVK